MEKLDEQVARRAVVKTLAPKFIVPAQGTRISPRVVDFELIRRNDYDDRPIYRTRIVDGVLMGHFVGNEESKEL